MQCMWAAWQLYHYLDLFPEFVQYNVRAVKDVLDHHLNKVVSRIDRALMRFTDAFLYQYRVCPVG